MKTSRATLTREKAGSRPGNTGEGNLFVLVIDREKMIKQLLEAVSSLGPPLDRKD